MCSSGKNSYVTRRPPGGCRLEPKSRRHFFHLQTTNWRNHHSSTCLQISAPVFKIAVHTKKNGPRKIKRWARKRYRDTGSTNSRQKRWLVWGKEKTKKAKYCRGWGNEAMGKKWKQTVEASMRKGEKEKAERERERDRHFGWSILPYVIMNPSPHRFRSKTSVINIFIPREECWTVDEIIMLQQQLLIYLEDTEKTSWRQFSLKKKMQITFRCTDIEMTGSSRTGNMPGGKQQQRK